MAVQKRYYYGDGADDCIEKMAAKVAKDAHGYNYATPGSFFSLEHYFDVRDDDTNDICYKYIIPRYSIGWASDRYEIAGSRFYVKGIEKAFVDKNAAPLLRMQSRTASPTGAISPFYGSSVNYADLRWDNTNSRISITTYSDSAFSQIYSNIQRIGYGVFILLVGGGGGGGGGDAQYWGQGSPGGGGGGGGSTVLLYLDLKKLYEVDPTYYARISIGSGGGGGSGGSGFQSGGNGDATTMSIRNSSGYSLVSVYAYGGKGGTGHSWDHAEDSAGGTGGTDSWPSGGGQYSNIAECMRYLGGVSGGAGAAGKRGSDATAGNAVHDSYFDIPFTTSWPTKTTFTVSGETHYVGYGSYNNGPGGGGGGSSGGFRSASSPIVSNGYGMGGRGGGENQAGLSGRDGGCVIFYNYIAGVSSGCDPDDDYLQ